MAIAEPPRSRSRWLIPVVLLLIVFAFCGGLGLLLIGAAASSQKTQKGTVLELKLAQELREAPTPLASVFPGLAGPPSLFEIRTALIAAAKDDNVAALRLDIEGPQIGWGEVDDLLAVLDTFRKAKKPVHAYLRSDIVNDIEYAVALGADKVWMAPDSALAVNGFQAEVTFWRGTLEKLHVEPQYIMFKEYKSAGEPMSRHEMSQYFRESVTAVLADIWEDFLGRIAARRALELDAVRTASNLGMMTGNEALEAKWVDRLGYDDELRETLRKVSGTERYRGLSLRKYLDGTSARRALPPGDRVAVVFGNGAIVSSTKQGPFDEGFSGPRVARAIRAAADDSTVKGILFRVDSPGGSAVGSDHVWRAIQYARKDKRKPVVVSMSSVAGSGGYWVAMGADAIVAQPTTITGSIGVVFGKLNLAGFYELIGAHIDTVKVGDNADILSFVKTMDAAQTQRITSWMESIYEEFKRKVAEGRKLDVAKVEEIAKGRIWSGTDAKDLGLVDRLGGYDEALALVREKAGIAADAKVDLVIYPQGRTLLDLIFSEEPVADAAMVRDLLRPESALERALGELARPGAWLLMPELTLR